MTDQPELPLDPDQPETNPDFERIFGQGPGGQAPPTGAYEPIEFDPSEAGFARLPKDDYEAAVAEPPVRQTSQNGNPMMKVAFLVTGPDAFYGTQQWRRYMLSGRAAGWTKEFLEAIGLNEEAEGKKPIEPMKLVNRRLIICVRPQKNNPDYDEVWKVRPHPDGPLP